MIETNIKAQLWYLKFVVLIIHLAIPIYFQMLPH